MAFLLNCPNCGQRNVYDFRFGGEVLTRPPPDVSNEDLTEYLFFRENADGPQREWWNHNMGCRKWFIAVRNTHTNEVIETNWPPELESPQIQSPQIQANDVGQADGE